MSDKFKLDDRAIGYFWAGIVTANSVRVWDARDWPDTVLMFFIVVWLFRWTDRRLHRWRRRSVISAAKQTAEQIVRRLQSSNGSVS